MVTKSIIDRILILAAVVCAAGLAWQLTVLLTSKGQSLAVHKADTAVPPPSTAVASAASVSPETAAVRVVYPPEQGLSAPKTTAKVPDGPVTPTVSSAPVSGTPAAPAPVASAPAAPAASNSPVQPSAAPAVVAAAPVTAPTSATPAPVPALPTTAAAADPAPPGNPPGAAPPVPSMSATDVQPQPAHWTADTSEANSDQTQATASLAASPQADPVSSDASPVPAKVASVGEPPRAAGASAQPAKRTSGGGININNASVDALDHLRGGGHIGQAIARHRPYRSIEDLVKKRVLRRDIYEQIKRQIATQ